MRTYRVGDIIKLAHPQFPWEEPDGTEYVLTQNNGPSQQLIVNGAVWKQPDIWSAIAITGDRIGDTEYTNIWNMILVRPASALGPYPSTLPEL